MKTTDFAKLLRKVGKAIGDDEVGVALNSVARVVEHYPTEFRKPLQRVAVEPEMDVEEIQKALVTIKLFIVQPMLAGHLDIQQRRRAEIALNRVWNALLPDYATEEKVTI